MTDFITDAVSYRTLAGYYLNSAKILEPNLPGEIKSVGDIMMWIPFYFLISHSAELFLKCALLKRGVYLGELKKIEHRHNLKSLLDFVELKGVPVSLRSRNAIDLLSEQHSSHGLRYLSLAENYYPTKGMPTPKELYEVLDELLLLGRISTHGV